MGSNEIDLDSLSCDELKQIYSMNYKTAGNMDPADPADRARLVAVYGRNLELARRIYAKEKSAQTLHLLVEAYLDLLDVLDTEVPDYDDLAEHARVYAEQLVDTSPDLYSLQQLDTALTYVAMHTSRRGLEKALKQRIKVENKILKLDRNVNHLMLLGDTHRELMSFYYQENNLPEAIRLCRQCVELDEQIAREDKDKANEQINAEITFQDYSNLVYLLLENNEDDEAWYIYVGKKVYQYPFEDEGAKQLNQTIQEIFMGHRKK